jgi:primary-amine oxidase
MAVDTALADPTSAAPGTPHPLDPLTGAEIERAAAIVQGSDHTSATLRFVMISLAEPPKPASLEFDEIPPRKAFTVAYDNAQKMVFEGVVDLDLGAVESWTPVPGRFPSYLAEHMDGVEKVVREDPGWQEAMRKRGVTDFDLAMIDPWPATTAHGTTTTARR